MFIHL